MARRTAISPTPQAPILTIDGLRNGINRIKRRIEDLEKFDPSIVTKRFPPDTAALEVSIDEALSAAFGHGTPAYNRYASATRLDTGPIGTWIPVHSIGSVSANEISESIRYLTEGKEHALVLLKQAVRSLEESLAEQSTNKSDNDLPTPQAVTVNRKIFLVHGHDEAPRETVARFIQQLGFEPVILHERANKGSTIIEKVEAHSDVGFAIVILTSDDEGCVKGGKTEPRARQNVLLELGYFVGRLGRTRVCALKKGELEIPSDFSGIVYTPFDSTGGWKQALGRELEAAGFNIDWNKVMRS